MAEAQIDEVDHRDDFLSRMARTYATAIDAAHRSGVVSIHVGQEVWDTMRAFATEATDRPLSFGPDSGLAWGFPVCLERDFLPDTIKIRVTTVIP